MNQSLKCAVIVAFVALANASPAEIQITPESGAASGFGAAGQDFGLTAGGSFTGSAASALKADPVALDGQLFRGLRSSAASFSDAAVAGGFADRTAAGARDFGSFGTVAGDFADAAGAGDFGSTGAAAGGFRDMTAAGAGDFGSTGAVTGGFPYMTAAGARDFSGSSAAAAGGFADITAPGAGDFLAAAEEQRLRFLGADGRDEFPRGISGDAFGAQPLKDELAFAAGAQDNSILGGSAATSGIDGDFGTGIDSGFGSGMEGKFDSGIGALQELPKDDSLRSDNSILGGGAATSGIDGDFGTGIDSGFGSGGILGGSAATSGIDGDFGTGIDSGFGSGVEGKFDSGIGALQELHKDDSLLSLRSVAGATADRFDPASGFEATGLGGGFAQTAGVEAAEGFMSGGGALGGFEVPNDRFDAASLGASASFATADPRSTFSKRGLLAAANEIGADIRQATGDVADEVSDGMGTVKDDIRGSLREIGSDIRQASGDVADEFKDGAVTVKDDFRSHIGRHHGRHQKRGLLDGMMNLGGKISQGVGRGWTYTSQKAGQVAGYTSQKAGQAARYTSQKVGQVAGQAGDRAGKIANSVKNNRMFVKPFTLANGQVVMIPSRRVAFAGGVGVGAGGLYIGSKFLNDDDDLDSEAYETVGDDDLDSEAYETVGESQPDAARSDLPATSAESDAASNTADLE